MIETYIDDQRNKYEILELVVRPQCNHNCEYCYIKQYGNELYPQQENNITNILTNINQILDYIFKIKQLPIKTISIFSGNLFEGNLFWLILSLIYKLQIPGLNVLFSVHPAFIIEPNFVEMFDMYNQMFLKANMRIWLSISADGRKIDRDKSYNYNDVIDFAEKYNFIFHPMISATNVQKWSKNYDWWMRHVDQQPMIMEVRNDDWTQDKIDEYIKVLDHIFNYRIEMCNNDLEKFAYHYFIGDGENNTLKKLPYYDIIKPIFTNKKSFLCTLQNTLTFDVTDNTLLPCHRIAYSQFRGAQLIDGKLVDKNTSSFITLGSMTRQGHPKCSGCIIKQFCMGPCMGAQFEAHGDLFTPNDTVCNLMQQKIIYLFKQLTESGVLQIGIQNGWASKSFVNNINKLAKDVDKLYV